MLAATLEALTALNLAGQIQAAVIPAGTRATILVVVRLAQRQAVLTEVAIPALAITLAAALLTEQLTGGGEGSGDGSGTGTGTGTRNGDGNGDGDGDGDGDGSGLGNGMLAGLGGAGDRTRPTWGPLLQGHPFRV